MASSWSADAKCHYTQREERMIGLKKTSSIHTLGLMRVLRVVIFASINDICHHYWAKTSLHRHICRKAQTGAAG